MSLPPPLHAKLSSELGAIDAVRRVGGGQINESICLTTSTAHYFLKWHHNSPNGMFTAEAQGLRLLASAGGLTIPKVILVGEASDDLPAFLVLEWLAAGERIDYQALGAGLAQVHRQTADEHGLDHDNFIGKLRQINNQHNDWAAFYRDFRIGVQQDLARQHGRLPPKRDRQIDKLRAKLPSLLPSAKPSLLHGDLWSGNVMATVQGMAIVDPAAYYGHREAEIAYTELFGGFSRLFYDTYDAEFPLEDGYAERKPLYNLYHLINHLNHFGESYGSSVDAILRRYVGD